MGKSSCRLTDKAELREVYDHLDLVSLKQRIDELQDQLLATLSE
jgi:hypothetical protein